MKEKILQMVDAYWKFDEAQQPTSSWHDKQDLLKALEELLQPAVSGRSEQLKCQCKKAKFTRTVDADFNPLCGRCGKAL
jgi:hypothetical protein